MNMHENNFGVDEYIKNSYCKTMSSTMQSSGSMERRHWHHHSPWASTSAQTVDECEDDENDVRKYKIFNISFVTEYVNSMANEDFGFWICLLVCIIVLMYIVYYTYAKMNSKNKSKGLMDQLGAPPIY